MDKLDELIEKAAKEAFPPKPESDHELVLRVLRKTAALNITAQQKGGDRG